MSAAGELHPPGHAEGRWRRRVVRDVAGGVLTGRTPALAVHKRCVGGRRAGKSASAIQPSAARPRLAAGFHHQAQASLVAHHLRAALDARIGERQVAAAVGPRAVADFAREHQCQLAAAMVREPACGCRAGRASARPLRRGSRPAGIPRARAAAGASAGRTPASPAAGGAAPAAGRRRLLDHRLVLRRPRDPGERARQTSRRGLHRLGLGQQGAADRLEPRHLVAAVAAEAQVAADQQSHALGKRARGIVRDQLRWSMRSCHHPSPVNTSVSVLRHGGPNGSPRPARPADFVRQRATDGRRLGP